MSQFDVGPMHPGLAGALGRRGRGALKKSYPCGGAGLSKKVRGADFHKIIHFAVSNPDSLLLILSLCPPNDQTFN
jgi:hypothetical protein